MNQSTVLYLLPEIVLAAAAVAIYLAGTWTVRLAIWRWAALASLAMAAGALATVAARPGNDPIAADGFAWYGRWLALGVGTLVVLAAWRPLVLKALPEYFGSLLLLVAGLMLVASANDLVLMFVGLELVSIPTYILLYLGRRDIASQEATAKYFYLSVLASALLLYGLSFLYGTGGSTDLRVLAERFDAAAAGNLAAVARLALGLILAGLCFRITAVPFHFYAPDVYQGTTHANAGMLSVVTKTAGLLALVRITTLAMPGIERYAWPTVLVLSALTMTLGNTMALWQTNLRRLMAYSSIAHAGYLLLGVAVHYVAMPNGDGWDGLGAMLFYLVVYAAATLGMFAALAALGTRERQVETVDELAGLAWTGGVVRPALAWAMAIFLFSLAGLPPLAGFWGKLALFASALNFERIGGGARPWFIFLAVLGVLNSVVSAGYYLRIVSTMFFATPQADREHPAPVKEGGLGMFVGAMVALVLVLAIGVRPGPWIDEARRADPRIEHQPASRAVVVTSPNVESQMSKECRMTK